MKKLLVMLVMALLVMPAISAVDVGTGITPDIGTEDFAPLVWACSDRVVYDDDVEGWRTTIGNQSMTERINNYAFEGEQIQWTVLVMDKNGINKIEDVFATIGDVQGAGNDIEVNCIEGAGSAISDPSIVDSSCNARILEEDLTGDTIDTATQRYYTCTFSVETSDSMYGEYWLTVEATDLDGLSGTMDENEYWFFNPVIALSIDGDLTFEDVRPGTASYSSTLLVGNDADDSSGVLLDMFITGTDFYDSSSSGAMCPTTNQLALTNFAYFATNGAYNTRNDNAVDSAGSVVRAVDAEGYVNIEYADGFSTALYDDAEIIQDGGDIFGTGVGYAANVLAPGAEMSVTFKLNLPEPCNGDFDTGSIYFWGEAI